MGPYMSTRFLCCTPVDFASMTFVGPRTTASDLPLGPFMAVLGQGDCASSLTMQHVQKVMGATSAV